MIKEAHLEPGLLSMMVLFLRKQLTVCSLVDVWLGSKYVSGSLDAPCEMAPPDNFILKYLS